MFNEIRAHATTLEFKKTNTRCWGGLGVDLYKLLVITVSEVYENQNGGTAICVVIFLKESKSAYHRDSCASMLTAVLVTILMESAYLKNQLKNPSTDDG